MPKYEYFCTNCEDLLVIERSMFADEGNTDCPRCDLPTKRVFGFAGAHFKGQGWGAVYRTHTPKKNIGGNDHG